ncbi:MAG: DUF368 domain-containing protein [Flavobacteriaceae bacterium]|nr:DUF368 domain-containing protein [Flavobacteriaceae bacterium]|tara:strand:+ start:31681 stop:32691 length:1011 start_codon:yes stop_codon:yes gene_type:complete
MKKNKKNLKEKLKVILNGIIMGTANKIPGVSGGIVAVVIGFYEELIFSLEKLNIKAFKYILKKNYNKFWEYTNGEFLCLLFLGIIISFFSVSLILDILLTHFEINVWATFFGMILSSLLLIIPKVKKWSVETFLSLFIGLMFGLFISFSDPLIENENLIFIFFCGIISISGMTLPGLSGSFLLLILGNYNLLLVDSVNVLFYSIINILKLNFDFFNINENIKMLKILFVFVLGCIFGIIAFSKLLGHLLRNFYNNTMALIIGFVSGTVPVIWPWKKIIYFTDNTGNPIVNEIGKNEIKNYLYFLPELNSFSNLYTLLFILIGFIIIQILEYYGRKN